jgi:hypothetical protein
MVLDAHTALKRSLRKLEARKLKTEEEIRAVRAALKALGMIAPKLTDRRKRAPMDAAERRAVSRRMKAYWAQRKAGKKG